MSRIAIYKKYLKLQACFRSTVLVLTGFTALLLPVAIGTRPTIPSSPFLVSSAHPAWILPWSWWSWYSRTSSFLFLLAHSGKKTNFLVCSPLIVFVFPFFLPLLPRRRRRRCSCSSRSYGEVARRLLIPSSIPCPLKDLPWVDCIVF